MTQTTLERPVRIEGLGIHTGERVRIRVLPAREDSWITFRVKGGGGEATVIPGAIAYVSSVERCTALSHDGRSLHTVEHLMSAARGLELDNLDVEVEGGELPILDGSVLPFAELLRSGGRRTLSAERRPLKIDTPCVVAEEKAMLMALPADELTITYVAHFPHPMIGTQVAEFRNDADEFLRSLAPARTFGFIEEVEKLRERNLALGGSLDNALIVYPDRYSTPLRMANEMAGHKCLDLLGDLALLGRPFIGRIVAFCTSHRFNVRFVRVLHARLDAQARNQEV